MVFRNPWFYEIAWEKVKKGKAVLGYDFFFTLVDKHGLPQ